MGTQHGEPASIVCNNQQGDLLYSGATQEPALITANTGKNQERFWKNMGERARRVEISKEEIPGSKCSIIVWLFTDLLQALKEENLSALCSQQTG